MKNALDILKEAGAILPNDHFVGTSGLHFDTYVNKDALFPHTKLASEIGMLFALKYKDADIDTVVAPALGGIILSQWTAYHLSELKGKEIFGIYTEKTPEKDQIFTRGYDQYVTGKNVLIIEDSTVTGGSVIKVVNAVKNIGGNIVGVCVMTNKDSEKVNSATVGAPFDCLNEFNVPTYTADACPMCKAGVPINVKIGHGKKFLEGQGK
ncbi:phosphoribosyltransferase [Candidatus Nomurabacteria bacterium]|nr:phosphoribosyltransferase [Candidatus Nomurabacteria bacterium]